ncbi:hypothetical protein [Leifsonia sp. TF02-11]|uniref:hypothetical protein n=1 Tax=Leifsonia sp. TF02-11 TaxID=2815212 RepID=UPI001AA0F9CB|nr:hypothetical protein [Leifsonia sp. TF02-11]MBO1739703.1 hypothetical protein [Leifsonia sp. TF02-11]
MSEIDKLLRTAQQQHSPEHSLALAQIATAKAIQEQTEQLRIANRIALGQYRVALNDLPPFRHLVMEPRGEDSVAPVAPIREGLGL